MGFETRKRKGLIDFILMRNLYMMGYLLIGIRNQTLICPETRADDQTILNEYQLFTRQLPPKRILLLQNDILVFYPFDYSAYPPLKYNVTVSFTFKFVHVRKGKFFTFHENKNQPNLSYLIFNASQIPKDKPADIGYRITANFSINNISKNSTKFYQATIHIVDKYTATKANFGNFEQNFTFRMRSNDTDLAFPINSDDIFGNNLNLTLQQTNSSLRHDGKILFKINPRASVENQSFYSKGDPVRVVQGLGISSTSDLTILQRIDKPSLFMVEFLSYNMYGGLNLIKSLVFNDLEITSSLKVNSYTFVVILNAENKNSYMLILLLKMEPQDPLPFTGLFYPDYNLLYYEIGSPLYDASFSWKNINVVWVYKLEKENRTNIELSDGKGIFDQRIRIVQIFLPDQSMIEIGEIDLGGLKDQLNEHINLARPYEKAFCKKIETFLRFRGVLGCELFRSPSEENSNIEKIEIFISFRIVVDNNADSSFRLVLVDVITGLNPQGKHLVASCLMNLWHDEMIYSEEKQLMKPFTLIYHQEGDGYYMKSQTDEWLELIKESEIGQGLELKKTICQDRAKAVILIFEEELDGKRKVNRGFKKRTWSRATSFILNIDSRYNGNNRILTKIEKEVPFDKHTTQAFESSYDSENKIFIFGITGQLTLIRRMYFRTKVYFNYPQITLSSNSTQNFTANMKIYLDQKSEEKEGAYGFPFKIEAQSPEEFKIELRKQVPILKNGKYDLEEYLKITGPMNSMQQVSVNRTRLKFISRSYFHKPLVDTAPEYLIVQWVVDLYFLGITKNKFYLYDFTKRSSSQLSYSQRILAFTISCCSSTTSFYTLHYDPKRVNALSVRLLDVVPNYKNTDKTVLQSYNIKYINYSMFSNIYLNSSKRFLKSVGDRVLALCIYDKKQIKVIILDYIDKNNPIVTPMRDINIGTIGRRTSFMDVGIVSLMTKSPQMRTLAIIIGTKSHILTKYLYYSSSKKDRHLKTTQVKILGFPRPLPLNGWINYLECSENPVNDFQSDKKDFLVKAKCNVVLNGYLMRTMVFSARIFRMKASLYYITTPTYNFEYEYEIPRFFNIISTRSSEDYTAVHLSDQRDYHQEILLFKRGRKQVWVSNYASSDTETTYDIGKWVDGTTWLYINEIGSDLKVYLVGNITIEVEKGYDSAGELKMFYSTFEKPSEVENFTQEFMFSENLVRKSNLLLVIYGGIGGFFGVLLILWCCYCWIWRCVFLHLETKFHKKEKRWIPILVKKHKS